MDLTQSIAPKSDQLNAEDLLTGPRTFTIHTVNKGSDEQPVNVHLVELPGRPYRPSKSMLRLMVAGWGEESDAYAGHRLTLYRDPEIKYGGAAVGGIAISHMSHMDKPLSMALTVTRGKRKLFTVKTLAAAPALKQADLTIPAKVLADTAKALAEDTVDAYLEYLAANNAPAHILNYVTEQTK